MENQTYFYEFLEPISKELAYVARELEQSIFTGPRTMLTHARIFVENILKQVIRAENLQEEPFASLKDRIDLLDTNGYLTPEICNALHYVRRTGNQASHDARKFRYSEALLAWESVYTVVKWYVEVYGPIDFKVPEYQDPSPQTGPTYDISELEVRLKSLEELLLASLQKEEKGQEQKETAAAVEEIVVKDELPGFTTIRTISFKDEKLEVPYFLRDAFLLPQRFPKSETLLIRLGAEQQGRIMSELPNNLEGLHKYVKRYSEKNDEVFFGELAQFIEEEKARYKLSLERKGELFLFFKDDYVVLTDELKKIPLTVEEFNGIPNLLRQLNQDEIETVGQLPKELVILAKYERVGVGTVEKLFEQLKEKQIKGY